MSIIILVDVLSLLISSRTYLIFSITMSKFNDSTNATLISFVDINNKLYYSPSCALLKSIQQWPKQRKKNNWRKVVHHNYRNLIRKKFKTLKSCLFTLVHPTFPHFSSHNTKKNQEKDELIQGEKKHLNPFLSNFISSSLFVCSE
jgi:hypothetical protein